MRLCVGIIFFVFIGGMALGKAPESSPSLTGKKAADQYFKKRKSSRVNRHQPPRVTSRTPAAVGAPRYLSLHFGTFFSEETYKWGHENKDDVGKFTAAVSYRIGEWTNSMDLLFRADFISYQVDDEKPYKISLLPMITFPDANSEFPLYFGGGVGLGVFFKQVGDESSLSLDYQLVAGGRFFNVLDGIGLSIEGGMKNQLHLLSDGQHQGVFASIGTVFAF